jgi:hypothetical protein
MNHALLELQEVDSAIAGLAREKAKLDDGTAARARRDELEKQVNAERERGHKLAAERTDKELQLKTTEDKLKKQQTRLMSATSAHEVKALERDIEGLGHARGDLDEALLNLMDEGEQSASRLQQLEKELTEATAEVSKVEADYAAAIKRIQATAASKVAEHQAVVAKLSPAEKAKYDSVAKSHGGIAVAKVVNGNCSVCGTNIPLLILREAKTREYPTCESCGRLLFVEV